MAKIKLFIQQNKSYVGIFAAIFILGIFLRVYNFNGLLTFGFDQARDATLARNVIDNHQSLPLLGPHAMGTRFKVGPIYYYFQYLSAIIFGNTPASLAYPDLFFSILTIPLLLLFLRKYFDPKIVLALTGLWSVSFFAIKFSRFAWNPNSLPFFMLLLFYALLELSENDNKNKKSWSIVAGVALGVAVQLHTLSFLIAPAVGIIFLWLKYKAKKVSLKNIGFVFAIAILLNVPQILSELQTGGQNTKDFVIGVEEKLKIHTDVQADFLADITCHIQANSIVISSFGNTTNCSLLGLEKLQGKIRIALAFVFSILGYAALYYFWRQEKNPKRKNFLQLLSILIVVSFLVFFLLASDVTDRYYLVFAFVPIVLLGLIYDYLRQRTSRATIVGICILAILILQNGITLKKYFTPYQRIGLMEDSMLSENQALADFILANSSDQKIVYIDQRQGDWRIMNYFLVDKMTLVRAPKDIKLADQALPYFFIADSAHSKMIDQAKENLVGYRQIKQAEFGVFAVVLFSK